MARRLSMPFGRYLMGAVLLEAWLVSTREWAGTHMFRATVGVAHLVDPAPLASMPSFFVLTAVYLVAISLWTIGVGVAWTGVTAWVVLAISASLEASAIGRPNPTLDVIDIAIEVEGELEASEGMAPQPAKSPLAPLAASFRGELHD